jgi:hypothetical protein
MSVAKARARHEHNSGSLQVSKASLEVQNLPTDGKEQGRSQWFCAWGTQGTAGSCDGSPVGVQREGWVRREGNREVTHHWRWGAIGLVP